ncbi:MAG: hypothetical protein ACFE94_05265 [Candidatus Hodarchaeota archaeon]
MRRFPISKVTFIRCDESQPLEPDYTLRYKDASEIHIKEKREYLSKLL